MAGQIIPVYAPSGLHPPLGAFCFAPLAIMLGGKMNKRPTAPPVRVEIDPTYEAHVNQLGSLAPGQGAAAGGVPPGTALESVRQVPPKAWTPAHTPDEARRTAAQQVIAAAIQPLPASDLDNAFTPMPGAHDATSAKDRAAALNVKMAWQVAILGGAGFAILLVCLAVGAWVDRPGAGFFVGAVAGLVLIFTVGSERLNQMVADDNEYSREGTERHRIDRAVDVQLARMEHETELRRMGLAAVLRQLGVRDDEY